LLTQPKPFLLIVDDDLSILNVFLRIFQRRGYNVATAKNGQEAIQKINSAKFDIALIDHGLPDMEGSDLFPIITKANPKTVKIMLTGKTSLEPTVTGVNAFIGKPVSPEKLLSIIETNLKNRDMES
jgi:DNA-binding NtrC family response regulator